MSDYHKGIVRGLSMAKRLIEQPGDAELKLGMINLLIEETEQMEAETKPKTVYRKRAPRDKDAVRIK